MKVTIESTKTRITELEVAMVAASEQNDAITASRRAACVALENDIKGEIAATGVARIEDICVSVRYGLVALTFDVGSGGGRVDVTVRSNGPECSVSGIMVGDAATAAAQFATVAETLRWVSERREMLNGFFERGAVWYDECEAAEYNDINAMENELVALRKTLARKEKDAALREKKAVLAA